MKILIVEDEPQLADSLSRFLETEGFLCSVARTLREARMKLDSSEYDLVILDLSLPDGSGLRLIPEAKAVNPETGILVLTAKDSMEEKIQGLDEGADDYMTKPFHLAELNARVAAIMRRRVFGGQKTLQFNRLVLDPSTREVHCEGNLVDLTKKEFDLLLYFMVNKKRVLSKEAITTHLWQDENEWVDSFDFIYTHIKNLRKKIRMSDGSDYIRSVYGVGYKFSDQ